MRRCQHRLLTAGDEVRLARRIERGDCAAKEEMIVANLRLVHSVAWPYRDRGVAYEDLFQEGTVGLVRAVERFDHRRGVKFSTYAIWWVRRSVLDALGASTSIQAPRRARRQLAAIQRVRSELRRAGAPAPTADAIANRAGLGVRTVDALLVAPHVIASLDEPVGDHRTPLGQLIAAADRGDECSPATEDRERTRELWTMLGLLPRRQREVLLRRYGLGGHRAHTHGEIAAWLGVGEERSRQLERQALHWLRELARGPRLAA